jgi:hypothetical protein
MGSIIAIIVVCSTIICGQLNPYKVRAGTKNFCSIAFLQCEYYQNPINNQHNFPKKHHHHGVLFAPPMGWDLWIRPI